MGQNMYNKERGVFKLMLALLVKQNKSLPKLDLKLILKWVTVKCPDVIASSISTTAIWDDVGVKLYDLATIGHKLAMGMVPSGRVIFETLKKPEQSQAVFSVDTTSPLPSPVSPSSPETGASEIEEQPQPSTTPQAQTKEGKAPYLAVLSSLLLTTALAVRERDTPWIWDQEIRC